MQRLSRRFAAKSAATCAAVAPAMQMTQQREFFNKGWDNASLDYAFRAVIRKQNVKEKIATQVAMECDSRTLDNIRRKGDIALRNKVPLRVYLCPSLGDAHRVLKAYSLTAYPILDEKGEHLYTDINKTDKLPSFADPDDDYAKVCIRYVDVITLVANELLTMLGWEASPRGAASLLQSLYRGAEIPDYVYETPRVIEQTF